MQEFDLDFGNTGFGLQSNEDGSYICINRK